MPMKKIFTQHLSRKATNRPEDKMVDYFEDVNGLSNGTSYSPSALSIAKIKQFAAAYKFYKTSRVGVPDCEIVLN